MPHYDFDLFTIGAGSGGVAASRRAASYGARVAICEGSRVGGTCVVRGCVPKKLLMYGAQFGDAFADAAAYGWHAPLPQFDWPTLLHSKDREVDRLTGIYVGMLESAGVKLIPGFGRLLDAHTIEVGPSRYTARLVLIATGGWPSVPPIPGGDGAITSNEALELGELPHRMIVIGGGYIAVEFVSIFRGLGVDVTMLVRGEALLNGFDDDIRVALAQELRKRGIEIHLRTRAAHIARDALGVTVVTEIGQEFSAGLVFAATGRRPNTRDLGLEAAGVALGASGGIRVDDWSRTSVDNIFAIGDVTDRVRLTPIAIAEGRAFAESLFNATPARVDYRNVPTAVFSTPPIGVVGLTEQQARAACGSVDVYRCRFRPLKHTVSGRDEQVVVKLVVDPATDRVLGAHMLGIDAPEIIQGMAIALNCGATKRQFDQTIGLHPSAAEEFVTLREKVPDAAAEAAD